MGVKNSSISLMASHCAERKQKKTFLGVEPQVEPQRTTTGQPALAYTPLTNEVRDATSDLFPVIQRPQHIFAFTRGGGVWVGRCISSSRRPVGACTANYATADGHRESSRGSRTSRRVLLKASLRSCKHSRATPPPLAALSGWTLPRGGEQFLQRGDLLTLPHTV
ncbi:hypothetical protein EYF80_010225 [Liparis tanakae]|uniref:Uncharacterized protein n=1 Tax=Liparis tanakae TaxID=230148 RepID=A0A4Z2IR35_9TELE|nr:hypothetical protein EYF80_010225 [Liparis tanakae]